jgi:hypothetical protein
VPVVKETLTADVDAPHTARQLFRLELSAALADSAAAAGAIEDAELMVTERSPTPSHRAQPAST